MICLEPCRQVQRCRRDWAYLERDDEVARGASQCALHTCQQA